MKKSAVFGMLFTLIAGMAGGVALGIQIERGQAQPPETVSALSSPEPGIGGLGGFRRYGAGSDARGAVHRAAGTAADRL